MEILPVEDASELPDWHLPLSFMKTRHTEKIEGLPSVEEGWRVKDRLKTWSVALALCLNIGVDPPDVVKTNPCANLECWIDPLSTSPQKSMEMIGNALLRQYERWQPRARYKQLLDPTTDDVRKLCMALRKNAKTERVLFHYNGHGVPKPTTNGEIWVFNKSYTQYIPLSIYDLQSWMGKPSVYVLDCSQAGQVIESFRVFSRERESEYFLENSTNLSTTSMYMGLLEGSILMGACGPKEVLPMNPKLPGDLFTSCLTTPIKTALHWYCTQNIGRMIPGVDVSMIDKIPGKLNDRKTPLGELNWIFTAITDTIAWNTLPQDLFQKLFRQDLLVASLFRNFLLAERIMRSYNCTPETHPCLPHTYHHPLWQAWDLAVDHIMAQLPDLLKGKGEYEPSSFFPEQLDAFQVWLISSPNLSKPPTQLPIILQFLLSQAHRLQALELLGRYLDMGPEAVYSALSVGIFPYILKLLASKLRELQPILVFIWAKILAVDPTCQSDLVKDGGYKYFISVLSDNTMQFEYRTMATFILSAIATNYRKGQEVCLQNNVISICLEQLEVPNPVLRQWLAICLGRLWQSYDSARWCGVRDSAHEKLTPLLWDAVPEVRAAAVFALGTYIKNAQEDGRNDHATSIELSVVMTLLPLVSDGSPIVRQELVTAICGLVFYYEKQFQLAALRTESDRTSANLSTSVTPSGWIHVSIEEQSSSSEASTDSDQPHRHMHPAHLVLNGGGGEVEGDSVGSSGSSSGEEKGFDGRSKSTGSQHRLHDSVVARGVYLQVWRVLLFLASDPSPNVGLRAGSLIQSVHDKLRQSSQAKSISQSTLNLTASLTPSSIPSRSPNPIKSLTLGRRQLQPNPSSYNPSSTSPHHFNPGTSVPSSSAFTLPSSRFHSKKHSTSDEDLSLPAVPPIPHFTGDLNQTGFCTWSAKYFANSLMKQPEDSDPASESYLQREYRFLRNHTVREDGRRLMEQMERAKFGEQVFVNKESKTPQVLKFHPYQPQLAVLQKASWSVWDVEQGLKQCTHTLLSNTTKVTAAEFTNPHDITFLMTGSDDGCVRVWRHYAAEDDCSGGAHQVTAWRALTDIIPSSNLKKSVGMVMVWEQATGLLYASGDVRYIRLWDTHKELKIVDIPAGIDTIVSSLALDTADRSLLVAGCADGTVRMYDKREPPTSSLLHTLKEHNSLILNVHVQQTTNTIVSVSANGEVKTWDPRFARSLRTFSIMQGVNVCALHHSAPLLACANQQAIKIYNIQSEETLSHIRYHDGFMGQKIGPTSALTFHPYKLWLAAGGTDGLVSIYSTERKK